MGVVYDKNMVVDEVEFEAGSHPTCLCACAVYGLDLYTLDKMGKETFLHTFRPPKNEMKYQMFQSCVDTQETMRLSEKNIQIFRILWSQDLILETTQKMARKEEM